MGMKSSFSSRTRESFLSLFKKLFSFILQVFIFEGFPFSYQSTVRVVIGSGLIDEPSFRDERADGDHRRPLYFLLSIKDKMTGIHIERDAVHRAGADAARGNEACKI